MNFSIFSKEKRVVRKKNMEDNDGRRKTLEAIKIIFKGWKTPEQVAFLKKHAKTSAGCCGYFNFFECPHTTHDDLIEIHCTIDLPPPLVDEEQNSYVERVTTLLHNVSRLSTKNKMMTQSLLNCNSLADFAALLVSKSVDEKSLREFEANVAMALDTNSPLSIVFQKAELIRDYREIVFGILGLPLYSSIHQVASPKVCDLLRTDKIEAQVFEGFLKKL